MPAMIKLEFPALPLRGGVKSRLGSLYVLTLQYIWSRLAGAEAVGGRAAEFRTVSECAPDATRPGGYNEAKYDTRFDSFS